MSSSRPGGAYPSVISGWRMSGHARDVAVARRFTVQDVASTLTDAPVKYDQSNYGPGRRIYQRGDVALAVHEPSRTVISVLLNEKDDWTNEDCHRRVRPRR